MSTFVYQQLYMQWTVLFMSFTRTNLLLCLKNMQLPCYLSCKTVRNWTGCCICRRPSSVHGLHTNLSRSLYTMLFNMTFQQHTVVVSTQVSALISHTIGTYNVVCILVSSPDPPRPTLMRTPRRMRAGRGGSGDETSVHTCNSYSTEGGLLHMGSIPLT